MKKLLFVICMFISFLTLNAQERGDFSIGVQLPVQFDTLLVYPMLGYNITDRVVVGTRFNKKNDKLDVNLYVRTYVADFLKCKLYGEINYDIGQDYPLMLSVGVRKFFFQYFYLESSVYYDFKQLKNYNATAGIIIKI